jgi:NADH-quinone oxidoreductase subunit K
MSETALLDHYLLVGALLFGIGLIGFLSRRNMIVMFLCAEMMLQGVSVSLVAWGRYHNDFAGQALVIFMIAVAACEAALAMGLVLMLFERTGKLDIAVWSELREADQPAPLEADQPLEPLPEQSWPRLPPAGVRPEMTPEDTDYRRHV